MLIDDNLWLTGVSSRSYCKLIVLLFKISPMSVDIKKKVQAVLDHASNFPVSI